MRVFRKHKTKNLYWCYLHREYISHNCIPHGSLVLDYSGRDITKHLKIKIK